MNIYGFQSLTLLDYPGHLAATLFTGGCNYRCPFCHNGDLLEPEEPLDMNQVLRTLERRRGRLEGVCITGGEPTLHPELPSLIRELRTMGYLIKLDSNGTYPDRLQHMVQDGLIDYIAMDIKNSPAKYASTAGCLNPRLDAVRESISFLMQGELPFEFRTTLIPELHEPNDMKQIGEWIQGAPAYFLQAYRESPFVLAPIYSEPKREWMQQMLTCVLPYIPAAKIRGVD